MLSLIRSLQLLKLQLLAFAVLPYIYHSECFDFDFPSFNTTNLSGIRFVSQDSWYAGQNASFEDSYIVLTPNPSDVQTQKYSNIGKFVYKDPIQFKIPQSEVPNKVVSFSTSFSFRIITTGAYAEGGSGMAFFISDVEKAPIYSNGRYLGLVNPNTTSTPRFFAVEFDTHISSNLQDPSASHIGIDINCLISLRLTDTSPSSSSPFYPQLYLYSNYTFKAWVEYDSATSLIQVWMTNVSSSVRPSQACLNLTYDLSNVFEDSMYVGFTATNIAGENKMEGHDVYSWSFASDERPKMPALSQSLLAVIVSMSILLALGAFGVGLFLIRKKRRKRNERLLSFSVHSRSESSNLQLGVGRHCTLARYTYKELKRCSQGFSDQSKVGEGGFSSVYRATFADGSIMAVKRLKEGVRKEAEFSAELNIISNIRHRNLLQLQGWCYDKGEAMLVYKYMSNGSLESHLYGTKKGSLPSETRLKILVGVASALEYLHDNLGNCVVHRDVKAANVLLTESFEAKLGDFGLARLIGHDEGAVTMTVVGTPGYVAPEVVYLGKFTEKADVYSFGVLALEMAYGRPAVVRFSLQPEEGRIVDYAWMLHQGGQLMEALDSNMLIHMVASEKEQWTCVLHVALMCCNPRPECRPTMSQVSQALKGDTSLLTQSLPRTKPLYPTIQNWPSSSGSSSFIIKSGVLMSSSDEGGPPSAHTVHVQ